MGDYHNDLPIGRHAMLTKNGDVIAINSNEILINYH